MRSIDTHRSAKQILEEIRVAASDTDPRHLTLIFAVLLVKLSEEADASTRRLVHLTWAVFILIVLLLLLVVPPIVIPWLAPVVAAAIATLSSWSHAALAAVLDAYTGIIGFISDLINEFHGNGR